MQLHPGDAEGEGIMTEFCYKELCLFIIMLNCESNVCDMGNCSGRNRSPIDTSDATGGF